MTISEVAPFLLSRTKAFAKSVSSGKQLAIIMLFAREDLVFL